MSGDYANFEIEDFAFDETFQQWVTSPDSPQAGFWDSYLREHPHQTDKILAARELVLQLKGELHADEYADMVSEIRDNVHKRIRPKRFLFPNIFTGWQAAASVALLIIGLGSYLVFEHRQQNEIPFVSAGSRDSEIIEKMNESDKTIQVNLGDGSVVSLAKGGRLRYPETFDGSARVVHLSGEAFFNVKRNPAQPFLIYANETVTKVLGTSFTVKAGKLSPKVIVEVATGKVSVFLKREFEKSTGNTTAHGIVLTANQQAEFLRDQEKFSKALVEEPRILDASLQNAFVFDNLPLADVFDILERAYGVEIVFDPELVAKRSLTVSLEDEPLNEKLKIICGTMGLSYQIVDAKIIIETRQ